MPSRFATSLQTAALALPSPAAAVTLHHKPAVTRLGPIDSCRRLRRDPHAMLARRRHALSHSGSAHQPASAADQTGDDAADERRARGSR